MLVALQSAEKEKEGKREEESRSGERLAALEAPDRFQGQRIVFAWESLLIVNCPTVGKFATTTKVTCCAARRAIVSPAGRARKFDYY